MTLILVLILILERKLRRTTEACSNVEERRFKRRVGRHKKSTRLQPLRDAFAVAARMGNVPSVPAFVVALEWATGP